MVGMFVAKNEPEDVPDGHLVDSITPQNAPAATLSEVANSYLNTEATAATQRTGGYAPLSDLIDRAYGIEPGPKFSPEEVKKNYGADVKQPMTAQDAIWAAQQQDAQRKYENVTANVSTVKNFVGGLMGSIADPINASTLLIPPVAEARIAGALGKVGLEVAENAAGQTVAKTALGRAAVRGVAGGATVATAQLPLTAIQYGNAQRADMDYGIGDALRDELFAFGLGAITHPIAGAIMDRFKTPPSTTALDNATFAQKEDAAKAGTSQMYSERPVNVQPAFYEAEDAGLRRTLLGVGKIEESEEAGLARKLGVSKENMQDFAARQTPDEYAREQDALNREGTIHGMSQAELRDTTLGADYASREPTPALSDLQAKADELEQSVKEVHADNPELNDMLAENEALKAHDDMNQKSLNALSLCMMKG